MKTVFLVITLFVIAYAAEKSIVEVTTRSSHKHSGNLDWNLENSHSHPISQALEGHRGRIHDRLSEQSASNSGNYQSQRQSNGKLHANLKLAGNRKVQLRRGNETTIKESNRQEDEGTPEYNSANSIIPSNFSNLSWEIETNN